MEIKKYIKNGKVAVLYSPGYGAGWSTWAYGDRVKQMMFCYELAECLDQHNNDSSKCLGKLTIIADNLFPAQYLGGLKGLTIRWLDIDTQFIVKECDGSESVQINGSTEWIVA